MGGLRWPTVGEERGPQGELFDPEGLVEHHIGRGEYAGYEFLHVNARSIINEVPAASRVPFRHTVNVYRGCSHACTYCFARPTHDHLGLGIGEDFERRIVVKVNAVERLRTEVEARRWSGQLIAMGTNTDPYQRCEGRYRLTRGVLGVLADVGNPVSVLTKSTLVLRDIDVLAEAAARAPVRVNLSIATLDPDVWRLTEPGTPAPWLRVEAVRRLNQAGIACGVLVAPVLPGMSDRPEQLAAVVDAVVDAGAVSVSAVSLHLRPGVREHYLGWLAGVDPALAAETDARYARAYLPAAEQRRLTESVRGLVHTARDRHRPQDRHRPRPGGEAAHAGGPGWRPPAVTGPAPEGTVVTPMAATRWVEGTFAERLRAQMGGDDPVAPAVGRGGGRPPAAPTGAADDGADQLSLFGPVSGGQGRP